MEQGGGQVVERKKQDRQGLLDAEFLREKYMALNLS